MKTVLLLAFVFLCTGCVSRPLDERSGYSILDDERNETLAERNIRASHPELKDANVNVTSFHGYVLLSGQVNTPELSAAAMAAVESMRNVKQVYNELTVAGPTSRISRVNDSYLTAKVVQSLKSSDELESNRFKVVTENGVVYLMGLVSRQEADLAVEQTRQVYGIQKIVKAFEYLN